LAGCGDFDQSAPESQAVDCIAEHDAADEVKDDIGALAVGSRAHLDRQIPRLENKFFGDAVDGRVRMWRVPVGTYHVRAEAPGNLRRGPADAACGADQ
jgi:hypothetical protein